MKIPIPLAPQEGKGLHDWLLTQSRILLIDGKQPDEVFQILMEATKDSNRTTQDIETEIQNAIDGAIDFLEENPSLMLQSKSSKSKWVDPMSFIGLDDSMVRKDRRQSRVPVDQKLVEKIENSLPVKQQSGSNFDFDFHCLFANLDLDIAVCREMFRPSIKPLSELELDLNCINYQYIVPNSMWKSSAKGGTRSDFNVAERLYCVVEFDEQSHDYQWKAFNWLDNKSFPLVMVVDSGGKSLHGWFACFGKSEYKVKTFCRLATSIGADKTTWSPSQWVRMPNGWNIKRKKYQHVVWFSKKNLEFQNRLMPEELL